MKEITLFYLEHCPYCHNAKKALAELEKEHPEYRELPVTWVEESRRPELAEQYDYYYVPTLFFGQEKLYEAKPGESYSECKEHLRAAFTSILAK